MRKRGTQRRIRKRENARRLGIHQTWDNKRKTIHEKTKKKPTQTQKQKTKEFLKKAGLHKTRGQRISERKSFKEAFGYEQPRLSMAVGRRMPDGTIKLGKASRYRVKGKRMIRETKMVYFEPEYRYEPIPRERRTLWGPAERAVTVKPGGMRAVKGVITGERLIVKRVRKSGERKGGNPRGEGLVRIGSAAAIRQKIKKGKSKHTKFGKKGMKAHKAKKKKKKR